MENDEDIRKVMQNKGYRKKDKKYSQSHRVHQTFLT